MLKVKGARDEESIEMLDLLMNGRMVSTAFLYDAYNGYTYKFSTLVNSNKELASYCASNDASVQKHFENVAALFYADQQ